jgi:hypothetical protein
LLATVTVEPVVAAGSVATVSVPAPAVAAPAVAVAVAVGLDVVVSLLLAVDVDVPGEEDVVLDVVEPLGLSVVAEECVLLVPELVLVVERFVVVVVGLDVVGLEAAGLLAAGLVVVVAALVGAGVAVDWLVADGVGVGVLVGVPAFCCACQVS